MSNRYLIINADDFGICSETNDAIGRLFNEGRITSTTVMAPCRESKDAVSRAINNSKIKMGLHITLNSDFSQAKCDSISPKDNIPSLLDSDGKFYHDFEGFYKNAREDEVGIEINAQYDFVSSLGYKPDHADSHYGTLYGITGRPFLKEAFQLCSKHALPFRLPKSRDYITNMFGGNVPPEIEAVYSSALALAEKMGIHLLTDMITNPFNIKDLHGYEGLKAFYLNAIRNIKEGVTEIFLHPSGNNKYIMSITPGWQKRIWEYQFLLDNDMIKAIEQEDIKLVSWGNAPFDKF
jgi:predicted glycoside hydrolase/deacetylase ChbG (UPF0249 family)